MKMRSEQRNTGEALAKTKSNIRGPNDMREISAMLSDNPTGTLAAGNREVRRKTERTE